MPPQPMLQRRFYVFCLVHPGFCPVPSAFLSLRKNAERISMKFAGGIKPAPVALLVASRYALPGYGDRRVWVRGPRPARSLCQGYNGVCFEIKFSSRHRGIDGGRWLILGLETLSISRCFNQ